MKVNIEWTLSKILAYVILAIGLYAFIREGIPAQEILISSFMWAGLILTGKNAKDMMINK